MSDLSLVTTQELVEEISHRCQAFALAIEMPQNGDEASVYFDYGMDNFFMSVGLAQGLMSRLELEIAHQAIPEDYDDDEGEESYG